MMAGIDYCSHCVLGCAGDVPEDLKAAVETRVLKAGEVLYGADDRPRFLYCLRRGVVADFLPGGEGGAGGELVDISFAGEAAGLKGLVAERYGTDAVAQDASEVCAIPIAALARQLTASPRFSGRMIRAFSVQCRHLQSVLGVRRQQPGDAGLARLLVLIASRLSQDMASGVVCLTLPRRLLAQYLGVSASTVARQLDGLTRRRLVHVHRNRICLLDHRGLMELAAPYR